VGKEGKSASSYIRLIIIIIIMIIIRLKSCEQEWRGFCIFFLLLLLPPLHGEFWSSSTGKESVVTESFPMPPFPQLLQSPFCMK